MRKVLCCWSPQTNICSLIFDSAAAIVLAGEDMAKTEAAFRFRAAVQPSDCLPVSKRDLTQFEAGAKAWARAIEVAKLLLEDLSFVQTDDCFMIDELIEYEAMGLTPRGRGARPALEGWTQPDGKLPVNPSDGLKAKGHPIGATRVSMHVLPAMQLLGEAGDMQLPRADVAGVLNIAGTAVANYVSI